MTSREKWRRLAKLERKTFYTVVIINMESGRPVRGTRLFSAHNKAEAIKQLQIEKRNNSFLNILFYTLKPWNGGKMGD
jgi:hypothetical protein